MLNQNSVTLIKLLNVIAHCLCIFSEWNLALCWHICLLMPFLHNIFFPKHYFEELFVIKMKVTSFKHICGVFVGFLISLLCHSFSGLVIF